MRAFVASFCVVGICLLIPGQLLAGTLQSKTKVFETVKAVPSSDVIPNAGDSIAWSEEAMKKLSSLDSMVSDTLVRKRNQPMVLPSDTLGIDQPVNLLDSLTPLDSLNTKVVNASNKLNTMAKTATDSVQSKMGSGISKIGDNAVTQKIDSIGLKQKGLNQKANGFYGSQQKKVNKYTQPDFSEIPGVDVGGQPGLLPDNIDTNPHTEKLKTPGLDIPGADLPERLGLPKIEGLGVETPTEGVGLELPAEELKGLNIGDHIGQPVDGLNVLGENPMKSLNGIEAVDKTKQNIGQVGQIGQEVEGYNEALEKLKAGDASELENKVEEQAVKHVKELQVLTEHGQVVQNTMGELKEYRPSLDKKELSNKLKQLAKEQGSDYVPVLQTAFDKTTGFKKKYDHIPSIQEFDKKTYNPLRGTPWYTRVLTGTEHEILAMDDLTSLDITPFIGYQVRDNITLQAGYSWRFGLYQHDKFDFRNGNISGPRASIGYAVFKGFEASMVYEYRKATTLTDDLTTKTEYHHGLLIGINKRYKILGGLYGSAQLLFNPIRKPNSLYLRNTVVRFGFYFNKTNVKKADKN